MRLKNHPAIVRTKKLNGWGAVGSSAGHTWRTITVAHADPARTHLNEDWREVSSPKALRAALEERIALADRKAKRPVLAIEYLVTAPHEAFEENGGSVVWRRYFEDALAWIEQRHGRDNVVAANIQLDEATPHLVAYACPLVRREATTRQRSVMGKKSPETGKQGRVKRTEEVPAHTVLSADHFLGTREKMIRMQSEFAAEVGEKHGLRRGIERSALSHIDLKTYHDAMMRGIQQRLDIDPEILKRQGGVLSRETPEQAATRVAEVLQAQVEALSARAATADLDRKRAKEWEQTAANAQADRRRTQGLYIEMRRELEALVGGLTEGQVEKVREYRQKILTKREEAKTQRQAEQEAQALRRRDQLVANLRHQTARQVADMPAEERRILWRELIRRDGLEKELDRLMDSGLFEPDGTPRSRQKSGAQTNSSSPRPLPSRGQAPMR